MAFEKKTFYKTFLTIAIPISLQQIINSLINFIDTLMIGGLDETAVAGVGMANKLFFIFIVSLFGIYSGAGIFSAQYWGKKDLDSLHKVQGIMITLGIYYSLIFVIIGMVFPVQYMHFFSKDMAVINAGVAYLRFVSPSYFLAALSFVFAYSSRLIEQTGYPMYISLCSLLTNSFLNYGLIYGKFCMPNLGIEGAAIATTIARFVEVILFYLVIYKIVRKHPLKAPLKSLISFDKSILSQVLSKAVPVFFNEIAWVVGQTMYFVAYGLLGAMALTSVQIATTTADVFSALFVGIASACHVMIGKALGQSDFDTASWLSKKFIKIMIIMAFSVGLILSLSTIALPYIYTEFSQETLKLTSLTMITMALFQIPKNFTYIAVIGILRSGGDAKFCFIADLVGVWFVGIPLAFFAADYLKLPIYFVVAFAYFEELIKLVAMVIRVKSGIWIKNLVDV